MQEVPLAIEEIPLLDLRDETLQKRIPVHAKQSLQNVEIELGEIEVYPGGLAISCRIHLLSVKGFPNLNGSRVLPILHLYAHDDKHETYVAYPQLQTMTAQLWDGFVIVGPKFDERLVAKLFVRVVGIQWLITPAPTDKLSFFFQNGSWNFEIPLTDHS